MDLCDTSLQADISIHKYSITPRANKDFGLPKVKGYRPPTSVAEQKNRVFEKTSILFKTPSSTGKFSRNDTTLSATRNTGETKSSNMNSIFIDTEVLIDKIHKKVFKSAQTSRASGRKAKLYNHSTNTASTSRAGGLFNEYDSLIDDVSGPMVFATPFTSGSERSSYAYDTYKANIPSVLIESRRF